MGRKAEDWSVQILEARPGGPGGAKGGINAVRVWCHGAVFVEHFLKHLQRAKIRTGVVGHGGQNVLSCGRSGPGIENAEDGAETGKVCPGRVSRIFQDLPGFQCSKASLGRERSIPLLHVSSWFNSNARESMGKLWKVGKRNRKVILNSASDAADISRAGVLNRCTAGVHE